MTLKILILTCFKTNINKNFLINYGERVVQSELIWKHMELYGSIKNKKGGFLTLNLTPYVFTTI